LLELLHVGVTGGAVGVIVDFGSQRSPKTYPLQQLMVVGTEPFGVQVGIGVTGGVAQ
jgi:hypothetical protein